MWKRTPFGLAIAGLVQDLPRALRIVRVFRHIGIVGPVLRRQNAVRRTRLVAPQVMNDGLDIDRIRQRVPDANIPQDRVTQVKRQVGVNGSGRLHHGEPGIGLERDHGVGSKSVAGHVSTALAQLERACRRVGNDLELYSLQLGRHSPIVRVALDNDLFVLLRADKTKRAGADGIAIEIFSAAVGHDANRAVGKIPQQGRQRFLQMEDYGVVIWRINVVDRRIGACL